MKLDASKIISLKEVEDFLFGDQINSRNKIPIGAFFFVATLESGILRLLEEWVKRIDIKIDDLRKIETISGVKLEPDYFQMLSIERAVTFVEYKELFYTSISQTEDNEWLKYPAFRFFNIISERQRLQFASANSQDTQGYINALLKKKLGIMDLLYSGQVKATLPIEFLKMHSYIVAPTGSGKSELLRLIFYELQSKYDHFSLILIDPHGDLAKKVKRFHINAYGDRVIYFDPFLKDDYTPTFNVFDIGGKSAKNLADTVEQFITSFEEILQREGGELTESMMNMLEKSIYFLLSRDHSTLTDLQDLLNADAKILAEAIRHDQYFDERFLKTEKRSRDALIYRVERLLNSTTLRPLIAGESSFSLENSINSGKIIIFNLGNLSELTQATFGKFLIANIKSLVRKRNTENVVPTFVFIDECQNLVSGNFEYMLSQLRKYGLHLILANQYPTQLGDQLESVKQNTAIKIIAGEYDEIKSLVPLNKDEVFLRQYEYLVKIRHRPTVKVKPESYLINNPMFELTAEQEQLFDDNQIQKYYKKISNFAAYDSDDQLIDVKKTNQSDDISKPPYDLYLGENGS